MTPWTPNTGTRPIDKGRTVQAKLRRGWKGNDIITSPAGLLMWAMDGGEGDILEWREISPAA